MSPRTMKLAVGPILYLWERNVGYGTRQHLAALAVQGLSPHHRRSFCLDEQVTLDDLL